MFSPGVGGHPSLSGQIHLHHLTKEDPLAEAAAGDKLLALPQQLMFRSQCVLALPVGRRPLRAAHGWDREGNREEAKPSPGTCLSSS